MAFLFAAPCSVDIVLADADARTKVTITHDKGKTEELYRFVGNEDVKGKVVLRLRDPSKPLPHNGVKIEFIGQIELFYDRGNHHDFTSLQYDLFPPGQLSEAETVVPFEFLNADKQYESYNGVNVRLRYFLRVTIARSTLVPNVSKEQDIWVVNYYKPPEMNNSIKMEVGIEDCLHIEFEYNKTKYHLKDVIIGKVFFLLVRIRIKYMELCLIKRETTGQAPNTYNESETLTKYELMDGAPVKGESIPVRLFLGHFDLTPTYRNVHNKFSVKYFLNLVLVDEEDRRYFKQQEITMWRRSPSKLQATVTAAATTDIPKAIEPAPIAPAAATTTTTSATASSEQMTEEGKKKEKEEQPK